MIRIYSVASQVVIRWHLLMKESVEILSDDEVQGASSRPSGPTERPVAASPPVTVGRPAAAKTPAAPKKKVKKETAGVDGEGRPGDDDGDNTVSAPKVNTKAESKSDAPDEPALKSKAKSKTSDDDDLLPASKKKQRARRRAQRSRRSRRRQRAQGRQRASRPPSLAPRRSLLPLLQVCQMNLKRDVPTPLVQMILSRILTPRLMVARLVSMLRRRAPVLQRAGAGATGPLSVQLDVLWNPKAPAARKLTSTATTRTRSGASSSRATK